MADAQIPLDAVNDMDEGAFVDTFGDVAEHSPWVAAEAAEARPLATRAAVIAAFQAAANGADTARQRALLAHPDLAGRTPSPATSRRIAEGQAGAGLDRLTAESSPAHAMNGAYRDRYILRRPRRHKDQIPAGFETRLGNPPETEFATALAQVCRIVQFRLEDRVAA